MRLYDMVFESPHGTTAATFAELKPRQSREKPGVLVVDDDHAVRIMVQICLERNGFDVWLARNGWEALERYQAHAEDIAVVLLDVQMPGLDGVQTLDALRQLHPPVVVCFMSGNTGGYEKEELLERGAAHVIAKPFNLDELVNILRLLAQRAFPDPLAPCEVCDG